MPRQPFRRDAELDDEEESDVFFDARCVSPQKSSAAAMQGPSSTIRQHLKELSILRNQAIAALQHRVHDVDVNFEGMPHRESWTRDAMENEEIFFQSAGCSSDVRNDTHLCQAHNAHEHDSYNVECEGTDDTHTSEAAWRHATNENINTPLHQQGPAKGRSDDHHHGGDDVDLETHVRINSAGTSTHIPNQVHANSGHKSHDHPLLDSDSDSGHDATETASKTMHQIHNTEDRREAHDIDNLDSDSESGQDLSKTSSQAIHQIHNTQNRHEAQDIDNLASDPGQDAADLCNFIDTILSNSTQGLRTSFNAPENKFDSDESVKKTHRQAMMKGTQHLGDGTPLSENINDITRSNKHFCRNKARKGVQQLGSPLSESVQVLDGNITAQRSNIAAKLARMPSKLLQTQKSNTFVSDALQGVMRVGPRQPLQTLCNNNS